MNISDIKKAPYNPRKMSRRSKEALLFSLKEFDDISGIVVNTRTGNILSGNHRWDAIIKMHGKRNITLEQISDDYYAINAYNSPTGFLIRVVDWDESKEKAANVAANSDLLHGEFTESLQEVLSAIEFDDDTMNNLRLSELKIDFSDVTTGVEWTEEQLNEIQNPEEIVDSAPPMEPREIRAEIKISVPDELKDEIKTDLLEFLAGQYYYGQIVIV